MKTISKITAAAMFAALFSLGACSTKESREQEALDHDLSMKTDQAYEADRGVTDSMQMVFAQTLNEIDHNLDLIREKEGTLVLGPGSNEEKGIDTREHIKRNIAVINTLMEQNKEKLDKLTAQLKKSRNQNALLTKLQKGAEERIGKLEEEVAMLKKDLSDRSYELAEFNVKMNDAQLAYALLEDRANKLDKEAYSAYYTVGSYQELKNEKVMTKEKTFLGLGKKKALAQDFKKDYFTKIDTRETVSIPLFAQKAKLVTFHPKNSFELREEKDKVTYLDIKDPEEFWKASKVLVVEVKI